LPFASKLHAPELKAPIFAVIGDCASARKAAGVENRSSRKMRPQPVLAPVRGFGAPPNKGEFARSTVNWRMCGQSMRNNYLELFGIQEQSWKKCDSQIAVFILCLM